MIGLTQKYVCDSCDVISGKKHHVDTYEIKLKKNRKAFCFMRKLFKGIVQNNTRYDAERGD